MRLALALVVAVIVAACAIQQSSPQRSFVGILRGDGGRSAQAALDAEAILQGMAQARSANERMARDNPQFAPGTRVPTLTR